MSPQRRRLRAGLIASGGVFLPAVAAVLLWPRTYRAEATLVIDGGAPVGNAVALASQLEAALLQREQLAGVALELPPELRSPDPIGHLRSGIRVASRGALGYAIEFRGSGPSSVQNVTNRLAERAVLLAPRLAAGSGRDDAAVLKELGQRSRAVTEFLAEHPEITVDSSTDQTTAASNDRAIELLVREKRELETRLTETSPDNPYPDPDDDPAVMTRRLAGLKRTIVAREEALKRQRTEGRPTIAPELQQRWRELLASLSAAQANAAARPAPPNFTAHVTARASLPGAPLTPNLGLLSALAGALSLLAGALTYWLPRRVTPRASPQSQPPRPTSAAPLARSEPPPAPRLDANVQQPSEPQKPASSSPAGPLAPQRPVVLSTPAPPKPEPVPSAPARPSAAQAPSLAPLMPSRPPPGAGSYSVVDAEPPGTHRSGGPQRSSVERLTPLQSSAPRQASTLPPPASAPSPLIMSRPPALDPDAETWAAHFQRPPAEEPARPGRWKTQVMGSMVPLEVQAAREERFERVGSAQSDLAAAPSRLRAVPNSALEPPITPAVRITEHDAPPDWRSPLSPSEARFTSTRDAILRGLSSPLSVVVSGPPGGADGKAQLAVGLGLALAEAGVRVLLLEADFDHPELHQVLGVPAPPNAGFSQQLNARTHGAAASPWIVVRCSPELHLLAEGRLRSPGLMLSRGFESALSELSSHYQVVVINGPPVTTPSDLLALDGLAHAAVIADGPRPPQILFGKRPLRTLAYPT